MRKLSTRAEAILRKWVWIGVMAILTAGPAASAQTSPARPVTEPAEEDLRIVEVVLDDVILADAMAAYAGPSGGTLLPLQAISELLALAITVKPSEGLASGFILDERRTFHVDVARHRVAIAGREVSFDPSLVSVHQDDIYVDSGLLSEWLPIAFDIDLFSLRVRVRPREPLPVQTRMERERRIRHWRLQLPSADPGYQRLRTGYRLWEVPSIDQTLRLSLGEATTGGFATYATGDLLYMESEAYLAGGDDDFFDAARFTLRRRDPGAAIGGWLKATEVAVGHIIHPSSGLLTTTSEPLPGFLLTNLPLHRPLEFDRHVFRGNLPPGWDVELYHNGALIDYQQSRPDGQYLFENVPVLFGMNFFRLVFYGPQGQRRIEEQRFLLGESLTLPGHFEYRLAGNLDSTDRRRASALGSYGLSRNLTLTGEAAVIPTLAGERRFGKAGVRAFWDALFTYADFVQDDRGARAWQGGMQTRIFGINLQASRQVLSGGFVSEVFANPDDPLISRDRLRVDTAIPAWILPRIPVSIELEQQRFTSGLIRTTAQNRLFTHYKGLSISNRTLWTSVSGESSRFEAGLQLSRYVRGVGIRGELLYTIAPVAFTTANLTMEKALSSGYRLRAGVSRSFLGSSHIYTVGVDKTSGSFAAGINAVTDSRGNATANVDLSAGLGRDPREGVWLPNARARAGFGALSARVFLDRDENGRFNAGDEPLPRVGFTINGVERVERTSDAGLVYVAELSPHTAADVAVDTRTLEDPQWLPTLRGVRVMPRPGKAVTLEVPVVATAEIEGTVSTLRGGTAQAVGGAVVELLDAAGNIVQQTTSAYDGFYVLTHVRRGAYRVRIQQEGGILQTSPASQLEKPVVVGRAQSVVAGIDFVLPHQAVPATDTPRVLTAERTPTPAPAGGVPGPARLSPALPPAASRPRVEEPRDFVVQIGTFSIAANAHRQATAVQDLAEDARVRREGHYAVVRTGPRTRSEALTLTRALAARGIQAIMLRGGATRSLPDQPEGGYIVQLGAFRSSANAHGLARQAQRKGSRWHATVDRRGALYFVQTTPFPTREAAVAASENLRRLGFQAIVRDAEGR